MFDQTLSEFVDLGHRHNDSEAFPRLVTVCEVTKESFISSIFQIFCPANNSCFDFTRPLFLPQESQFPFKSGYLPLGLAELVL
jgi:hypothetical protein